MQAPFYETQKELTIFGLFRFVHQSQNTTIEFQQWAFNQPNNARGDEDCVEYRLSWGQNGTWVDSNCRDKIFSICEGNQTLGNLTSTTNIWYNNT